MKNFTNYESNVSGLSRVCLGFVSGLSRFSLGEVAEKCGRYAAMIAILLTFSCGEMWGASPFTIAAPSASENTQDGITISGETASRTMNNVSSQACFRVNNSSITIFSESTNITGLSFDYCQDASSSEAKALTIKTATGSNALATPASGFTATKDGSSLASLSDIKAPSNTSQSSVSITFSSSVKSIEIVKVANACVRNISVTYGATTSYTTYYAATTTGTANTGSVTTNPGSAAITLVSTTTSKTLNKVDYYQIGSNSTAAVIIDLGSGHSFQVGDQIIAKVCGASNNTAVGFTYKKTTDLANTIVLGNGASSAHIVYVVAASDGIATQQRCTLATSNNKTYLSTVKVLRLPAACSTPDAPSEFAKSSVTATTATFSITDAGNAASYDLYYASGSPSAPTSGTTATTNVTTKTPTITGLTANTTYKIWVRSVCDASHKSDWVALGTTTFTTLLAITPSLSYANNPLVLTIRTTGSPTLTGNTGSGAVTWNSSNTGVATVDASGNITAVAAGTTTITASIAANGGYAAGEATATVKVAAAPLGIVDQKLATGSVAWDASVIVTSDYTNITSLTALSQHGSATASGNGNTSNGGQTSKIGTVAAYSDDNYIEMSFTVASGKKLDITAVHIPVQPVTSDVNNFKAVLSDDQGSTEIEGTTTDQKNGTLADIGFSSYGELKGTITLRIYAWGHTNGYRLGKNIYITGTIEDDEGCSAYEFHYGTHGEDDWETACFEQVGETNEWRIENFTIPSTPNFYLGHHADGGWNDDWSAEKAWTDTWAVADGKGNGAMVLLPSNGNKVGQATGAVGTLVIWNDSGDKNKYIGFKPNGYVLKFGSIYKPFAVSEGNEYRSDLVEYNSTNARDAVSVGMAEEDGDYVVCARTEPMQHLFLKDECGWNADGAKFAIYDLGAKAFKNGFMTAVPGESGLYEGWVDASCTDVIFVRHSSSADSPSWDNDWNQTPDLALQSGKNLYTLTEFSSGSWSAYERKGKFRMNADWSDQNWYVRFYPYNVLTYDANGGSGTMSVQSVEADAVSKTVSVATNGFTAPTGKHFDHWDTEEGDGGTDYAEEADYTLTANGTLYAQWAWNTYDVSTSFTNVSVKTGTTGTGAATHGSAYTVTLQGATGYNLPTTVTVTIGGETATLTTDYTWNSSTGVLTVLAAKVTGNISISATGVAQVYDITYLDQGGSAFSGSQADGYPTTHTYASATTLKTATKTGYTFGGWYTSVDCSTGLVTSLGATAFTADITLYAKWTVNSYSVTHTLTNVTTSSAETATFGTDYTATFSASSGYALPDDITVTIGGASTTYYTWNASTGALTIEGAYILGDIEVTIVGESEGCTPQTVSKVVVTGSSAGTTSGYNEKEYVGTPVISVNGKAADATNIDGKSGDETGYKMSSDGNSIVFATLSKGTFQEGDTIKIGITRRNDTRVISSNKNVLTIYYGTNKDDADSLTTISTGSTTTSGASEHEGAGFYKYTLTAADVTKIGTKKGIGLFRESSNGENPYVYSVEIIGCRDWTTCTAPTAVAADDVTGTSATFTITDAENTNNYELYVSTSGTSPTAETSATATSSEKTKTVTGLSGTTTYYYWVRSNCGGFKSAWVAGTPATFTTETAYTVTYNGNGSTGGSVPTDATGYAEGDVVTVKTNSGSLVKSGGYTFVGWSTNATPSSGIFYPAGYKFTMGAGNVTLYAVWASGGASAYYYGSVSITAGALTPGSTGGHKGFFTNEGGTVATSSDISLSSTPSEASLYYESSTLTHTELSKSSNWNTSSSSKRTIRAFKFANNTSYTLALGSATATKITFYGKCGSASRILSVGGVDWTSNSTKETFEYHEFTKDGNFTGNITIGSIDASSDNRGDFYGILVVTMAGGSSGYTVTFDKNGKGSYSNSINNVPSGSKIGAPIPAPTATGYEFEGWYREAGGTNAWNFASNTITKDTTLYAKWTGCAPTISADPSGTIYTKDAAATALSVTAATNDGGTLEYQWYSNEEDSNEDGTEIPGATSASYTPSTALIGTIYYYCVVTNDCGNATSEVAAITVNDSKSNPTASWTIAAPTHGGKGFSFSVTAYKNDGSTAWDGTLTTAMLSASEDVVLSGVTVSDNTISGTYGVKASATSPVTFYLELPSTTTQAAATLSVDKEFTACSGTGVDGSTFEVPVTAKYSSSVSGKPSYLCETTYGYISPELGTSSVSLKSQTYDDFEYWMNSGRTSVLICTKVDAVKKIQIYLSANGGAAKVTNVYTAASYSTALKDYTALDAKSDYTVTYTDESGNSSIAKGENGHVDIAFTTNLDSGTVVYVALKDAAKFYGAKLTTGAGSGATIDTELTWSNSQSDGATVEKGEDDAEFTITATRSGAAATASLGEIRYSSSDTKIATVNATTGEVTIADEISFGEDEYKTTTIKATLVSSGCYKSASITYTLQVNKSTCTEDAGTVAITSESDCSVELTVSGYEDGADIQWQKDGSDIPSATSTTYTATTSGTYTAVTTKDCARTSNSIVVTISATATASKIVDSWYVKNGRRTPDIALVQTTGATSFTVKSGETTIWDEANSNTTGFGGCDFELKEDGIIYLHGTKSNGDAPSDLVAGNETITVTVSGCGDALDGLDIIIKKQAETLKPSVAFVVDGTTRAKGGTAISVSTAKTSERPLWTYLSSSFTLTGCNIYWSVDSKELREYYSQYDAIVVTDDPKTQTTGAGGVEYVKAFGTLVDVRPILTMEAYVGRYTDGGWHVYNATPTSPNPRQVEMKLECKTHEIFAGVSDASDNVRTVNVNGDDYWYITIVDTTQSPYKGTTMDYEDLPALQGFDPSSFSDMLGIGTIHADALQAGVERQQEPAARMMILGIQNNAMGALTNEGKLIIKNAISYLLKTNMEEVDDCSNYFTGATNTDWNEPTNWSKNSVPDFATKVRIMAPVVISDGQKVRASQVDIVVDGTSSQKDGKPEGTVTINPGGALVVGGTVNRAIAPHYGIDDLEPTTSEDLIVQANADKSAALILDNSSGLTGATVQMYSSSFWELVGSVKKKYWSYVAVPIQEALIPDYFYGAFTYYYEEKSGWEKKWDGDYLYPFQGIGLSRDAAGIENFWGPLVSTENRDIKLTKTATGGGENLIANSWTAPIQIANFDADDFGDALATIYIYNTGSKDSYAGSTVIDANTSNQGAFTAGQWLGIPIGVAKLPEYTGLKVIPAMQTFEVDIPGEAPNGTETTLHLDYDRLVRGVNLSTDNLTEKLHAPKRSMNKNDGDVEAVMKVRVAGVHTLAEVWLIQDGAFGEGFDNGWEAYYAACDDRSPQLYAHSENGNMGIIAKQELEGTILGFAPSRDGADYTFSFYYRGDEELYLNDLLMETSTPITNEDTYSFTSSNNGNSNRFIISRNPYQSPLITTGTEEIGVEGQNSAKKIIYNDKIYILYNGVIYDAMGKVINRK